MTPPETAKFLDSLTYISWFDDEGILNVIPKPGAPPMTKEDSVDYIKHIRELTNNKLVSMIVQSGGKDPMPKKEARDWISKELETMARAIAVIYTSPMGRMAANLFFGFRPAKYPVKFFSNENDARGWIRQYLSE